MKRNQNSESQPFVTAFPSLSNLKITKSFLLSSIEDYLVARKNKKYELPGQGGHPIRTAPEAEVETRVRRFSDTEAEKDMSWFPKDNHDSDGHPEWCFCGCHAGRLG